jgi:hypothetical protein
LIENKRSNIVLTIAAAHHHSSEEHVQHEGQHHTEREEEAISFEEFEKPPAKPKKMKAEKQKEGEDREGEKKKEKTPKKKKDVPPKPSKTAEDSQFVPVGKLLSLDDPSSPTTTMTVSSPLAASSVFSGQPAPQPLPLSAHSLSSPTQQEITREGALSGSEMLMLQQIDAMLRRHAEAQTSLLERERLAFRKEIDHFHQSLPDLIDKALQKELKGLQAPLLSKTVTTAVSKSFSDTLQSLPKTLNPVIDKGVKDSLARYFNNENVAGAVTRSVMNALQPLIVEAFKSTFATVVIPGFERSAQSLFAQMHQAFQQGINQSRVLSLSFFMKTTQVHHHLFTFFSFFFPQHLIHWPMKLMLISLI